MVSVAPPISNYTHFLMPVHQVFHGLGGAPYEQICPALIDWRAGTFGWCPGLGSVDSHSALCSPTTAVPSAQPQGPNEP